MLLSYYQRIRGNESIQRKGGIYAPRWAERSDIENARAFKSGGNTGELPYGNVQSGQSTESTSGRVRGDAAEGTSEEVRFRLSRNEKDYINLKYGSEEKFNEIIREVSSEVRGKSVGDYRGYGDLRDVQRRTVLENFTEAGYIDTINRKFKLNSSNGKEDRPFTAEFEAMLPEELQNKD